jgi:hypothetical protein
MPLNLSKQRQEKKMVKKIALKMTAGTDREGVFQMKKSKILVVALIGLLMAVGFVLAGCDSESKCGGSCGKQKSSCWSRCTETSTWCCNIEYYR